MVFKQGPYKPRQDPADMLLSLGLDVPEDIWVQLNKQFMIVADCESYLVKDWGDAAPELVFETTSKLHYTHVHKLCCIAACSNVPGHEENKVFINRPHDPSYIFKKFISYCKRCAKSAAAKNMEQSEVASLLADLRHRLEQAEEHKNISLVKRVSKVLNYLENYFEAIEIFFFNGSSYDLPYWSGMGFASFE